MTVRLGQATLAPGETLLLSQATGPLLFAVESGALDVYAAHGTAWVRRGGDGTSLGMTSGALAAGDGVLIDSGTVVTLRNLGTTPAVVLAFTVLPDGA